MKIPIIRNTPEAAVLQRLGLQNREFYKEADIEDTQDVLAEAGHDVSIIEGDRDVFDRLRALFDDCEDPKDFMVYNLAYGVQGECRYTQIPAILELLGLPYVGSGPRAHTLSLDKYVAKIVMRHAGLPTPAFQLVERGDEPFVDGLAFPVIVKPQSESTSFGIQVVHDETELKNAVEQIRDEFLQPVLVEQFIPGIEVNCGLLGNNPPEALPVLEIAFDEVEDAADQILSFEVKRDRRASHVCPARIDEELMKRIQEMSAAAFMALGCRDIARLDWRIDRDGNPFILELNSMACIHRSGSFFDAAQTLGWTYGDMINRVLEAAIERYR